MCERGLVNREPTRRQETSPPRLSAMPIGPSPGLNAGVYAGGQRPLAGGQIGREGSGALCSILPEVSGVHRFNKVDFE